MKINIRKIIALGVLVILIGARCWSSSDWKRTRHTGTFWENQEKNRIQELADLRALRLVSDVDVTNSAGQTALMLAIMLHDSAAAQQLIARGADINIADENHWTALMFAVARKNIGILKELVARGVDVNAQTTDGDTALMFAVEMGSVEIVKILVDAGAKVDIINKQKETALDIVGDQENNDVANELKKLLSFEK